MLSSGLTLIFSMMGVLNFAHASFYMLGAYFAYQTGLVFGFWPALFLAPILVGIVGAITERYGLRKVHKFGHVAELLFTFGLAYVIEEIVHLIWGRAPVDYRIPESLNFTLFTVFNTQYPAYRAFMMLVSVGMLASLFLVLTKTRIGMIVQASLTHPDMVQALGHNVPRVFMLVFAGGCALAGLAGVLGGNLFITEPSMAFARRFDSICSCCFGWYGVTRRCVYRFVINRSHPNFFSSSGFIVPRFDGRAWGHDRS
jgi:branched-chain amino acid transport system permease protein